MPPASAIAVFLTTLAVFSQEISMKIEAFSVPASRSVRRTSGNHDLQLASPDSVSSPPEASKIHPRLSLGQVNFPGQRIPLQGPPLGRDQGEPPDDNDFNINVGRALDYLAYDVPRMFIVPPRLEIFTTNIVLKDPVGELLHGKRMYGALHTSLRVLGAITSLKPRICVTSTCYSEARRAIELKWTMAASGPFTGDGAALKLSAVSVYKVDDEGLIMEHAIDNRIKRDLWEYSHSWMGMLAGDRPPGAPPMG